jgi:hypothetical protein
MSVASALSDRVVKLAVAAMLPLLLVAPANRAPLSSAARTYSADWLSFETNACGYLDRVGNKKSALVAADIPFDFDDDDEWVNAWTMSPEETRLLNEWLLQHPQIGTITEAVEKECIGDEVLPIDDSDEPNIA